MQYVQEVDSGCPSRFAGGQRTVVADRKHWMSLLVGVQVQVRFEQVQGAARECKQ
jgi:hypothetical protein